MRLTLPLKTRLSFLAWTMLGIAMTGRAEIISDNLDKETGFTELISSDTWVASSFQSGPAPSILTTATLLLASDGGGGILSLALFSDNASAPGTLLRLLTSPSTYSTVLANTPFDGAGLPLDPDTTYWIVAAATGNFEWAYTYDTTGAGSGFLHTWGFSDDAGTTWFTDDSSPMQMRVEAATAPEVPEPTTFGLLFAGLAAAVVYRSGRHEARPIESRMAK